jgi:hypothetical protein
MALKESTVAGAVMANAGDDRAPAAAHIRARAMVGLLTAL